MIAALALSLPAVAHASDCIKANNQCTPVVGCIIGAPNELFAGEVRGVGNGTFVVRSNQGATCSGTFKRTPFGTAKVKTTCDDGRTGKATFSYYHKNTGTGRGKGRMSDGDNIVFWAGDRMWSYFQHVTDSKPDELIDCAVKAMEQSSGS